MMKKDLLFQVPLDAECSLRDALETVSIQDLQGILFYIKLQDETKGNREALIQTITNALPEAVQRFALCFDTERYQLFQTILAHGGMVDGEKISLRKIMALRDMGLLYPALQGEKRVLIVPREICDLLATIDTQMWKEVAACNTKIINRAHGLIYCYGFLETRQFLDLWLEKKQEEPLDNIYFLEMLYEAILYYGIIEPEEEGFRHKRFWNYEYIRNQQKELKHIPTYKVFPAEFLEQIGKQNRIQWTLPMERLKQFLIKEGHLTKNMARREVESAWYEFNNGIPFGDVEHYLMDWYFSASSYELQQDLISHLLEVFCTMPQWLLKGHSFEELGGPEGTLE